MVGVVVWGREDETEEFEHSPEDQPEEEGVSGGVSEVNGTVLGSLRCVAGNDHEAHRY